MSASFETRFQLCTVKLTVPGQSSNGTGFFVAPDLLLTCDHVARKAGGSPLSVQWNGQKQFAEAVVEQAHEGSDLALLRLNQSHPEVPSVMLGDGLKLGDTLYIFGYPDEGLGGRDGRPATVEYEGLTDGEFPLMQFKLGQIRPGMSGSPICNLRTEQVCGVVNLTRSRSDLKGGSGVPISTAFKWFPILAELNQPLPMLNTSQVFDAWQLDASQRKQWRAALISAFPRQPDLELMLEDELDEALNLITQGQPNYQLVVRDLVQWAESHGRLRSLLESAIRANSGNLNLQELGAAWLKT